MGRILSCHGKKTTGKDNNKTHPNHIDTIFSGKNRYGCCRNLEESLSGNNLTESNE